MRKVIVFLAKLKKNKKNGTRARGIGPEGTDEKQKTLFWPKE